MKETTAMLGTALLVLIAAPLSILIVHAKRTAIATGKSTVSLRSVAASLAAGVTAVAFTVALLSLLNKMSNVQFLPLANPWLLSAVAVAAAVWVEIQARCSLGEVRRFDQWGSLDIAID